jgi:hypothetical protein
VALPGLGKDALDPMGCWLGIGARPIRFPKFQRSEADIAPAAQRMLHFGHKKTRFEAGF